jgi:hypothetical protein
MQPEHNFGSYLTIIAAFRTFLEKLLTILACSSTGMATLQFYYVEG